MPLPPLSPSRPPAQRPSPGGLCPGGGLRAGPLPAGPPSVYGGGLAGGGGPRQGALGPAPPTERPVQGPQGVELPTPGGPQEGARRQEYVWNGDETQLLINSDL